MELSYEEFGVWVMGGIDKNYPAGTFSYSACPEHGRREKCENVVVTKKQNKNVSRNYGCGLVIH